MGDQPDPPKSLADPPSVHGVGNAALGANRGRTHRVAKFSHYEDGTPENKQHRVSALPKQAWLACSRLIYGYIASSTHIATMGDVYNGMN